MDRKAHWDTVYESRGDQDVSWFEPVPETSLRLLEASGIDTQSCIIDIGAGTSQLIDVLLARGLTCLTALDVSRAALHRAQARLGDAAAAVRWIEADVTGDWSIDPVDIWHDRAVFHFLTDATDRERYRTRLRRTLKVGGSAILATFAVDGPPKCSGLPVVRYSPESLLLELGDDFTLVASDRHEHQTPWKTVQPFLYARLTRVR